MEDMKYYCCHLKGKSRSHRTETSSSSAFPSWLPDGLAPEILCHRVLKHPALLLEPHPAGTGGAGKKYYSFLFSSYMPKILGLIFS